MLEQIRTVLEQEVVARCDPRIHHCHLEAAAVEGTTCTLTGSVLDERTREAALALLAGRFPGIVFDSNRVQVLRTHPPQFLTVATNLTGLFVEPSLRVEMASQLLNGWQVERLREEKGWVYVRQADDYLGWAYRGHFSRAQGPRPSHMVATPVALLHAEPDPDEAPLGRVVAGTTTAVVDEQDPWVRVSLAGDLEGWLFLDDLRALDSFPHDEEDRRRQMLHDDHARVASRR